MSLAALSSGCFIGHEHRLEPARLEAVELSAHSPADLEWLLGVLERERVRVTSVHCPCPTRGVPLNICATGDGWWATLEAIEESMEIARRVDAPFVVTHALYSVPAGLPSNDQDRMEALRRWSPLPVSLAEHVRSASYAEAHTRAAANLRSIVPGLRRRYPRQKLVLENLNPRAGYCAVRFQDLAAIARQLDGEVGLCLDVGHLALSQAVLEEDLQLALSQSRDLLCTTHVHQNLGGRFCVDRHWNEDEPRPRLQEVDVHLPLLARCRLLGDAPSVEATPENQAFVALLEGTVQCRGEPDDPVRGTVPVEELLRYVPAAAPRVLEMDSRYAPLDAILSEYDRARRGLHPVALW